MQDDPQTQFSSRFLVGGVDTHKDLYVAALVDEHDRVLAYQCFASTRQGYRNMLSWMQSFGEVERTGLFNSIPIEGLFGGGKNGY